ncbi:uncharacterized protein LOC121980023 [Zingiber officinale]|uniref:Uncharacterized protein n=1 Tax=Zingiber officinale TaxID=94328 RepID=A0A8J5GK31_ZINOF|nr:uncharacterized protein LOC121980023 [Zingiber officinale]KAG6508409.1 hypothetical protein ZIOFF_033783 [Zingiber officinale]
MEILLIFSIFFIYNPSIPSPIIPFSNGNSIDIDLIDYSVRSFCSRFRRVYDMLYYHRIDRVIYDRLIAHGANPIVARNIIALLYTLDDRMGFHIISYLSNKYNDDPPISLLLRISIEAESLVDWGLNNDSAFFRLIAEAESILACIRGDLPPRKSPQEIPLLSSLRSVPMDLDYFNRHRHETAAGIAHALAFGKFGRFFFDDALFTTFLRCKVANMDAYRRNASPPLMPPELETELSDIVTSVNERSLIINFLRASPLTEREIAFYFQEQLGNCVERVEKMPAAATATHLCTRVVFKLEGYVALVFHGQIEFELAINGKQVSVRQIE